MLVNLYGGKIGSPRIICDTANTWMQWHQIVLLLIHKNFRLQKELPIIIRSLRVHLQIIVWKKLSNGHDDLNPLQWGWMLDGGVLKPIMTDLDAAPD